MYPCTPILILGMHGAKRYAVRALKAGAKRDLNKNHITEELITAIRCIIIQNKQHIPVDVVSNWPGVPLGPVGGWPVHEILSDREFEVFCMIAKGVNIKSTGSKLSLSADTIYTYRNRIVGKTGLQTNVDIARCAIEHDLFD